MASWTLKCSYCNLPFQHSVIDATVMNFFLPAKPDFLPGGSQLRCPNCGETATYLRTDLIYRS